MWTYTNISLLEMYLCLSTMVWRFMHLSVFENDCVVWTRFLDNLVEYFNKWIICRYTGDLMPHRPTFNLENCRTKPHYSWYWAIYTKNVNLVWTLVHVTLIMYIGLSSSGPRVRIEIWPIQKNYDIWYRINTWLWLTTFIRNTSVTSVEISTKTAYLA